MDMMPAPAVRAMPLAARYGGRTVLAIGAHPDDLELAIGGALARLSRDGAHVSLASQKGNVVMVNFWATWCVPCRQEMPHLQALYERYNSLGFELLAVNVESDLDDARKWLEDRTRTLAEEVALLRLEQEEINRSLKHLPSPGEPDTGR